ncbi:MAG: sugar transferase [Victivallales bacterium]|nr:sugar transferase [Victivallales bacterium]
MYVYFKIVFDFLLAFIGLLLLSPLFIITAAVLAAVNKGSPFFIQRRPGKDGKAFAIIKFKTMSENTDTSGELLPDEQRLHFIGKIVRKSSLDEIPQLINVLKGEMSLVGPRPLLPEYLPYYNEEQKKRHLVRPGITGWAQVNGRNNLSWDEKFSLDVWYVENMALALDLKILYLTFIKVFKSEGVNKQGYATTEKFKGPLK